MDIVWMGGSSGQYNARAVTFGERVLAD